jgi:hypothetical protein
MAMPSPSYHTIGQSTHEMRRDETHQQAGAIGATIMQWALNLPGAVATHLDEVTRLNPGLRKDKTVGKTTGPGFRRFSPSEPPQSVSSAKFV